MIGTKAQRAICASFAAMLCVACAQTNPDLASAIARPDGDATASTTGYTEALRCLDQLMVQANRPQTVIMVGDLVDTTLEVRVGLRDIAIGAVSRATQRSRTFRLIDTVTTNDRLRGSGSLAVTSFPVDNIPNSAIILLGAITQADTGIVSEDVGAGAGVSEGNVSGQGTIGTGQELSYLAMDFRLQRLRPPEVLRTTRRGVTLRQSDDRTSLLFGIGPLGANFRQRSAIEDGPAKAVETLVELAVLELLGQTTQVPYWQCLDIDAGNPEVEKIVQDWWETSTTEERVYFFQSRLPVVGYGGAYPSNLQAFQRDFGLVAHGRPSLEAFRILVGRTGRPVDPDQNDDSVEPPATIPPSVSQPPSVTAIAANQEINLSAERLPLPSGLAGSSRSIRLAVTLNRQANLYCYLYDRRRGLVYRIFPNALQPNTFVAGQATQFIPDANAESRIFLDGDPVDFDFLCAAHSGGVASGLPAWLSVDPFTDLPLRTLDEIARAHEQAEGQPVLTKILRGGR